MQSTPAATPRLLEQVRELIRIRHYSIRAEQAYLQWIRRYIVFHGKRHPAELGAPELTAFLLGHSDVKTTMIYTHVLNRGGVA